MPDINDKKEAFPAVIIQSNQNIFLLVVTEKIPTVDCQYYEGLCIHL